MKRVYRLRVASVLRAPVAAVWAHAVSPRGINEELFPVHMHLPDSFAVDAGVPLGVPLGRCLVTLFGVVPIDVHRLGLEQLEIGRAFHERSTSWLEARWEHRRTVDPAGEGCRVEDEVTFAPRMLARAVAPIIREGFARRHRVLRRRFGTPETTGVSVSIEILA